MLQRFRDQVIARGYASEDDYTAWEDATRHPEWRTFLWFLASLWGRKPIEEVV